MDKLGDAMQCPLCLCLMYCVGVSDEDHVAYWQCPSCACGEPMKGEVVFEK